MLMISPELLRLSEQAVLLLRRGKILFANKAAKSLFGEGCTEKPASAVLPRNIASSQALTFSATASVCGKELFVRSLVSGDIQAMFFSRPDRSGLKITDAMLCSLRSNIMTLNVSLSSLRECADTFRSKELSSNIASISEHWHKISRLISNASAAKCILEENVPYSLVPQDVAELCSGIADTVSLLRDDVKMLYSGPAHLTVFCDRTLTELMLFNLISNALTHAEGATQIKLSLDLSGEALYFTVSDNGCGIGDDALASVFYKYDREPGLSAIGTGAGLGMTVVRGAASVHGGTLMLESSAARGTIVRVSYSTSVAHMAGISGPEKTVLDTQRVLTGLSGCLPLKCYGAQYYD